MEKLLQDVETSIITQWADDRVIVRGTPWVVYISVANICNSRCEVCA